MPCAQDLPDEALPLRVTTDYYKCERLHLHLNGRNALPPVLSRLTRGKRSPGICGAAKQRGIVGLLALG